ncbi:MAG: hypothetical protein ACXVLO_07195 [Acidimicrobiia bacterium]
MPPGRRIVAASWISNAVFLAGSLPALLGSAGGKRLSAGICLALFAVSLVVWIGAFAVAVARSSQGDDIAVGSLFLVEGKVRGTPRRSLYGAFLVSLGVTAIAASSNPFAVLVPMLTLGLVGLWGARHAEYPRRKDVVDARPLRPSRPARQRGGLERRADGRARP